MNVLEPGQVQLWWGEPNAFSSACLAAHARSLPEDEKASVASFVFEEDRKQSLLTRVMVRQVLSHAGGGLSPEDLRFSRTAFGRPVIVNSPGRSPHQALEFNLSHTRSLVVCAVAVGTELGVDIESLTRAAPVEIADRHFSPTEVRDLGRLAPELRSRRFLEYWTLKEAFVKALGRGLSVPLDEFSFHFRPGGIALTLSGGLAASERDVGRWRFFQGEIAPSHVLAVACSLPAGVPLTITFHSVAPLLLNTPATVWRAVTLAE